jgi:hypothetical protein
MTAFQTFMNIGLVNTEFVKLTEQRGVEFGGTQH